MWNYSLIEAILRRGIPQINLGVMLGFPHDDRSTIARIKERIAELEEIRAKVNQRNFNFKGYLTTFNHSLFCAMPLPGTEFYKQMKQEGRIA